MLIVIDANELFSLLIKGSKSSKEIFLSKSIELIAPEFIFEEFSNVRKINCTLKGADSCFAAVRFF